MSRLDKAAPTFYSRKEAVRVAAALQAGDPEWTYLAKHTPKARGKSRVEIRDEDLELIGTM